MGQPLRVGIVGVGTISGQYLAVLDALEELRLVAVTDLDPARAERVAAERPGVLAVTPDQLVAHPDVDVVLNLTTPAQHLEVALAAIAAGRGVYGEKPLATTTAEGRRLLDAASRAGVVVGCAPDTVLGTGIQTARRALDDGLVGVPISATATMMTPGHELWHPAPDFYYQPGGGPLFDMGPYYLSALVTLLGPIRRVSGMASRRRPTRTVATGPRAGASVAVEVDTHVTALLEHENGVLSTVIVSFDAVATRSSCIEVHGASGSLVVPDPNLFDGAVEVRALGSTEWTTLEPSAGYRGAGRGVGLVDLARTPPGDEPRAGGALAFHVLDVMESIILAASRGTSVEITSTAARPSPVPLQDLARREVHA